MTVVITLPTIRAQPEEAGSGFGEVTPDPHATRVQEAPGDGKGIQALPA
jgi:hypothetical protein